MARRVAAAQRGGNLSRAQWMMRRLDEEGLRLGVLTRVHLGACHAFTVCDEGHHHHLLCSSCNTVVPVDASGIESEIQKLAKRLQFRVDTHMLEFAGRCANCLAKAS